VHLRWSPTGRTPVPMPLLATVPFVAVLLSRLRQAGASGPLPPEVGCATRVHFVCYNSRLVALTTAHRSLRHLRGETLL